MDDYNTNQNSTQQTQVSTTAISNKSKAVAAVLAFFLGAFGAHRLYVGKIGSGVTMLILMIASIFLAGIIVGLVMMGVLWLIAIVDFIMILVGSFKDGTGATLK